MQPQKTFGLVGYWSKDLLYLPGQCDLYHIDGELLMILSLT